MFRAICVVVVVVIFPAENTHGRSILMPSDLPELPSSVEKHREHFDDELKRDKKSFLSTPFEASFGHLDGFGTEQNAPMRFPGILPVPLQYPHQQSYPEFVQHQHQHHHHQPERGPHFHHNEQMIAGQPTFTPPKHRNSREFFETLRDIFDDTNAQSYNDYIAPVPEPPAAPDHFSYVPPQHQPYHQPSYYTYQQYHTYQQQPRLPPQLQQQQPQPPPAYATPSSCGSNLLFSCQPQVRPVSCYESSSYVWPTSPPPPPPPPPAAPLYIPSTSYSYGNRAPNSATRSHDMPVDVYLSPGPPYMSEPNLGSVQTRKNVFTANSKVPSLPHDQRADSRPAPSNGEKKTNGHSTTEMSIVETTPVATTATAVITTTESDNSTPTPSSSSSSPSSTPPPPPPTLSPLTDEQIERFAEKLNSHAESLEKFREMARKKLREAMARSDASDEELSAFFDPQSFQKRQIKNSNLQSRPQLTNSVW